MTKKYFCPLCGKVLKHIGMDDPDDPFWECLNVNCLAVSWLIEEDSDGWPVIRCTAVRE